MHKLVRRDNGKNAPEFQSQPVMDFVQLTRDLRSVLELSEMLNTMLDFYERITG